MLPECHYVIETKNVGQTSKGYSDIKMFFRNKKSFPGTKNVSWILNILVGK